MLENLSDELKHSLRAWTDSLAGEERAKALAALNRPSNEFGVDRFGFNVDYLLAVMAPFIWLYKNYFRVETHGIEKVPRGRVLLVSNHGGQIPIDGAMIGVAMLLEANPPRAVRSMTEKWAATLPYISTIFARSGQIVGTPENCRRLLEDDEAVMVFPEGVRGISKLWPQRYQLQDFGLGFMRLALDTNSPVVPIGVIGAEEQAPAVLNLKPLGRLIGFPALPVTVTPLPLPTKYRIYFGDPLTFTGRPDDEDVELDKKVRVVKSAIQALLQQGLEERKNVFW
ncbi:MAG TPA: lysophospholipid acyltransferase family protein [Myxococcaceae bacterium]|nr:lysophospholipid acyltransferase family protein [Myxococcaceae bacterium]